MPHFYHSHKNKTFATLLASTLGALGAHRFYLYGWRDIYAWMHAVSLPLACLLGWLSITPSFFLKASPLILSALGGLMAALVHGLTSDELWDRKHNPTSSTTSDSHWPLALLLVLTLGVGSTALIASIARLLDLLLTGGAYG